MTSLHGLKCIISSGHQVPPTVAGSGGREGCGKRAGELHQSYVTKARKTDRKYCGTPERETPSREQAGLYGSCEGGGPRLFWGPIS